MRNEQNYQRNDKTPVPFPRTVRSPYEVLNTSARAGREMPGGFIPLMPEDTIKSGSSVRVQCQMEETEKMLGNAVRLRADAYFVSYAALEAFDGLDSVSHAWAGRIGAPSLTNPATGGGTFENWYKAWGEHVDGSEATNSLFLRAYNAVVNFKRSNVSKSLPERTETDATLARCLWGETALARVVPDWDAGLMSASANLQFNGANLPLSGVAPIENVSSYSLGSNKAITTDGAATGNPALAEGAIRGVASEWTVDNTGALVQHDMRADLSAVVAELSASSGAVSLQAIEMAKKTKTFAEMRSRMAGTDEDLIDLLMRGFSIPNQAYQDPILIGSGTSMITQSARYATDSANLDNYVANGAGVVDIALNLPKQTTGGCIVITYSITPEPVFDRQYNHFLYRTVLDDFPSALEDYLDEQPVEVVKNRFVDNLHTAPDGTFGYAPLNHEWSQRRMKMGGRYFRTLASDENDEDQQHVWSVRSVDPTLNEDTFLVPANLSHNVFLDTLADPFIMRVEWGAMIEGITQFGPSLYESTGDYAAVAAVVPENDLIPPSEA